MMFTENHQSGTPKAALTKVPFTKAARKNQQSNAENSSRSSTHHYQAIDPCCYFCKQHYLNDCDLIPEKFKGYCIRCWESNEHSSRNYIQIFQSLPRTYRKTSR
ncbi:hypothetical protein F8M41_016101 [Gigaspora margarita]|uniref:Uncharacterized protein n=1 Tax=Gigaspora margarita TaxID=4874 RepID=A0A8H4EMS7_GIGMA|nr:hypothetical protein F8M41_016101 [Gigaspora margarita]